MSLSIADKKPYQGFGYYQSTGVGAVSNELAKFLALQYFEAASRATLLRPKSEALASLKQVFEECRKSNWDAEGASAIPFEAYMEARNFIRLLPILCPMPEIVPAPNGQIGLEWYVERNNLLVVAIAGQQSVTYASLRGTPIAISNTLKFVDAVPPEILSELDRRYPR